VYSIITELQVISAINYVSIIYPPHITAERSFIVDKVRIWLTVIICVSSLIVHADIPKVNIAGFNHINGSGGNRIFILNTNSIVVSSSEFTFESVAVDGTVIAKTHDGLESSMTVDISEFFDGQLHQLELLRYDRKATCYFTSNADYSDINGIYYAIFGKFAAVISATGDSESVEIAPLYEYSGKTYQVAYIKDNAFRDLKSMQSVFIPQSVASIGSGAFNGCTSLKSLYIEDRVQSIGLEVNYQNPYGLGRGLFYDCPLEYVYLGRNLSYSDYESAGYSPFYENSQIQHLEIGEKVTTIPQKLFSKQVLKVFWLGEELPEGYANISGEIYYAVNEKYSDQEKYKILPFLKDRFSVNGIVYVPTSQTERVCDIIYGSILSGHENIVMTDKVKYKNETYKVSDIIDYAFYGKDSIKFLNISIEGNVGDYAFCCCGNLKTLNIHNGGHIGESAFEACAKLNNTDIYNGGEIGAGSFKQCPNLELLSIRNKGNIGFGAFEGCSKLQSVTVDNGGSMIGGTFMDCSNIRNVTINSIGEIGREAFKNCKCLETITLGDEVDRIGDGAFKGCATLSEISIPPKVTRIGGSAFEGCSQLKSINLPDNLISVGEGTFKDCISLRSIDIPENVTVFGNSSFSGCSSLESINIPDNVIEIGVSAFSNCTSLKSISLPDNVTKLGNEAFNGCSALEDVKLSNGLLYLRKKTFRGCTALSSVTIPNNVMWIEEGVFYNCSSLSHVVFSDAAQAASGQESFSLGDCNIEYGSYTPSSHSLQHFYVREGDILTFNYSVTKGKYDDFLWDPLIVVIGSNEVLRVSEERKGVFRMKFLKSGRVSLSITTRNMQQGRRYQANISVTDIWINGYNSSLSNICLESNTGLENCPIEDLYIGRNLKYYYGSPFKYNTSLKSVEISDSKEEIFNTEFFYCSNLQSIKIGNGVRSIESQAFDGCKNLEYFSIGYGLEQIGYLAFRDCSKLNSFYCNAIMPPICDDRAISDIDKLNCALHVPEQCVTEYSSADPWKEFYFVEKLDPIYVEEIQLNANEVSLKCGESFRLFATQISPADAVDKFLIYSNSNTDCISIDDSGVITALHQGTSIITVRSSSGNAKATCIVNVTQDYSGLEIAASESTNAISEVYTINGLKVADAISNLPPGLYIVRQGTKVKKILVK